MKACLAASIIFVLESTGHIASAHVAVYTGVVLFFLYFNAASTLIGVHDPFAPLESLVCGVFFGGLVDWAAGGLRGERGGVRRSNAGGRALCRRRRETRRRLTDGQSREWREGFFLISRMFLGAFSD